MIDNDISKKSAKVALRVRELIEQGPIGRTALYEAIRRGDLPARKLGASTFVLATDWHEFLNSRPLMHPQHRAA